MATIPIAPGISIDENDVTERFVRARGPADRTSTRSPLPSSCDSI